MAITPEVQGELTAVNIKYKITITTRGGHFHSTQTIEAKSEKDAFAQVQHIYGNNPLYEVKSITPETGFGSKVAITPEVQGELTTDKVKMKPKKQLHDWPNKMDTESKEGAIILESKKSKVGKETLQKGPLVMRTDDSWVAVSEFKENSTTSVGAPIASSKQSSSNNPSKRSKIEKKESSDYFVESNASLGPSSDQEIIRPSIKADNVISDGIKDKLTDFSLRLLYWFLVSPILISAAVFTFESGQPIYIWPLIMFLGVMASPLYLFICPGVGHMCALPSIDILIILNWIMIIQFGVFILMLSWPHQKVSRDK